MINKLTSIQEKQLEFYKDKWLKIGLSTNRIDREKGNSIIDNFYRKILQNENNIIKIYMSNPVTTWIAVNLLSVQNQVGEQVRNQVWDQAQKQVEDFIWPYQDGSFFSSLFSFYDYMINELNINIDPETLQKYKYWQDTSELGLIYPLDNFCIISEKPTKINLTNGLLHTDGGPAIEYEDDFCIWALNGIKVPKEIAETKAEDLDPNFVLKEKNAEVRREIIRKVGINRVIDKLGAKSIERYDNGVYELLNFDCIDGRYRPYLKTLNPSVGTWHVERVHPDCRTIEQALAWRNGETEYTIPKTLT